MLIFSSVHSVLSEWTWEQMTSWITVRQTMEQIVCPDTFFSSSTAWDLIAKACTCMSAEWMAVTQLLLWADYTLCGTHCLGTSLEEKLPFQAMLVADPAPKQRLHGDHGGSFKTSWKYSMKTLFSVTYYVVDLWINEISFPWQAISIPLHAEWVSTTLKQI